MIELKKKTDAAVAAKTESETTLKNLQKTHSSMQKKVLIFRAIRLLISVSK